MNSNFIDLSHDLHNNNNKFIYYKDFVVLKTYNGHILERDKYSKKEHYAILWEKKRVYL
jgi:hypothetical protein